MRRDSFKDPLELSLSRRRFLTLSAAAVAGAAILVDSDRPVAQSTLAGKPGTRWIGHL